MNLRPLLRSIIPQFVNRHFTWLSATLLGVFIATTLFLVLIYVPGVTANKILNILLTVGAWIITALTVVGALITIHEKWSKQGPVFEQETEDSNNSGLSTPAQGFLRTDEEHLQDAMEVLDGWFSVLEGGEISLQPDSSNLNYDRKGMLYVFASYVAYEIDERDTPQVSVEELKNKIGFTTASAQVFMTKMDEFIERNFDPTNFETLREMEDAEVLVELNIAESYEAAKYIIGERDPPN